MAYPVPPKYKVNQGFRSYATAGVVGRPDGSEIQYLVWLYGDYQHYGHAGADIACPIGTPVYAIADGIVVWADWGYKLPGDDSWGPNGYFKRWGMYKNFPGIVTVIWHPHLNKFSIYGHLSSNDMAPVGTAVREGQQIALSGNTKTRGEEVGPHLHIAVVGDFTNYSTGGKYIFGCEDPVPYFTSAGGSGTIQLQSASTITPIAPIQEDDMFEGTDRTRLETIEGTVKTLTKMLDNVASAVNETPGKTLAKEVPVANSSAVTSLQTFLSYAPADREATVSRIKDAITNTPAAELAVQIDAAGLAAEVRDALVELLKGK